MCRALRAAYIKNGGSDSHLLKQLAAVEKKAVAMMNVQQLNPHSAGIFGCYFTVFEEYLAFFTLVCFLLLVVAA